MHNQTCFECCFHRHHKNIILYVKATDCYVLQLASTSNEDEFKRLMSSDEFDFRNTCGITKPISRIKFSDKQSCVNAMCSHFSILVGQAELEQLRHGLTIQKFESLMHRFPSIPRKVFQPPTFTITSEYIQDLLDPVFSPVGSNKRPIEEALILTWIRYLDYLGGV